GRNEAVVFSMCGRGCVFSRINSMLILLANRLSKRHALSVFSLLLFNYRSSLRNPWAYAVHELVFGLLFLIIVAIPFRRRARLSWWLPMLANLTYTFIMSHYSTTTLIYSLIADVALPVVLLLHLSAFFGKSRLTS